ncbi:unnamed protein product, partial [Effrenium voratum]
RTGWRRVPRAKRWGRFSSTCRRKAAAEPWTSTKRRGSWWTWIARRSERFHHLSAKPKNISPEANRQRNAVFGTESSGVFRRLGDLQGHRINLDEVPMDQEEMMRWEEIKPDGTSVQQGQLDSLGIQLKGGYTISDLLQAGSKDAEHLVSITPEGLEGVHHYAVNVTPKIVNPKSFEEIWSRASGKQKADELPFLSRVAFDTQVPHRSGGAKPPAELPRRHMLDAAEEVDSDTDEEPLELDSETFEQDEHLAAQAIEGKMSMPTLPARESKHDSLDGQDAEAPLPPAENEDRRFHNWQQRSKTRGVGVFDPQVDFRYTEDPGRLEAVGRLDGETSGIYFRTSRPLPKDEDFVSTFRRPLAATPSTQSDPLGAAAPQIDLEKLKQNVDAKPKDDDLDIIFPSLPAGASRASRRPEASNGPAASREFSRLPLGHAKQARLKDDLSDLVKPGTFARRPGKLGMVEDDPWKDLQRPSLTTEEVKEHRNAALAAQQMLHRRLKQENRKKFASGAGNKQSSRRCGAAGES